MNSQVPKQKQTDQNRDSLINSLKDHIASKISPKLEINKGMFDKFSTETLSRVTQIIHDRFNSTSSDQK